MKFTLAPLALVMAIATVAIAQDTASATASSSSDVASSSATASSPAATSASSSAASSAAASSGVCELLPGYAEGDPRQVNYGCTYASTSTPVYDSASLASYLIGAYQPGKEGVHIEDVATQLAKSATKLYPTLTQDFNAIASQYASALTASISGVAMGTVTVDGALAMHANKILTFAGMAVAVIAGGALML